MNTNYSAPKLLTFVLSREHGYAAGVAVSSWFVLQYMGVNVMKARKRWDALSLDEQFKQGFSYDLGRWIDISRKYIAPARSFAFAL